MTDMERLQQLENWLGIQFPEQIFTLLPASADASFRRYFRITLVDGRTAIAMDAPPQHEDCLPFIHCAQVLLETGINVPQVLAQNLDAGFLLLSDLGNRTYLQELNDQPESADRLYQDATDALVQLQLSQRSQELTAYDEALLLRELNLFPDWYLHKHLQVALTPQQRTTLDNSFALIVQNSLAQPQVMVHRDYHSRNLMVTTPNPGVLDFQDAVLGPITYDLVSLFKDAYIHWNEDRILDWVIRYWEKARRAGLPISSDFAVFYRDFEWMGMQRHIKVLGIFARLNHRDGKTGYLNDMPRVLEYLRKACERYSELHPLLVLLDVWHAVEPDQKIGYTF